MSQPLDLTSARAKLSHADGLLATLTTYIAETFADEDYQGCLRADRQEGSDRFVLRIASLPDYAPVVERIALLAGDTVHNLHSALDHLTWQLACRHAGGMPSKPRAVDIPVCQEPPGKCDPPSFLDPADWATLHEFQPCKGVNGRSDRYSGAYVHQLTLLHEMDILDKHRFLTRLELRPSGFELIATRASLPPAFTITDEGLQFDPQRAQDPDPDADAMEFRLPVLDVHVGMEIGTLHAPLWTDSMDFVGRVRPTVSLNDGRVAAPTLKRLRTYVAEVLDQF